MDNLIEKYEKNFLRNDLIVCGFIFCAIFLLDLFGKVNIAKFAMASLNAFYPTAVAVCVTIFVFLLTCISIIIAFLQKEKMRELIEHGHNKSITDTYFSAIRWFGFLALISFLSTFSWHYIIKHILFWLFLIIFLFSFSRLIRSVWILKSLANLVLTLKEPEANNENNFDT